MSAALVLDIKRIICSFLSYSDFLTISKDEDLLAEISPLVTTITLDQGIFARSAVLARFPQIQKISGPIGATGNENPHQLYGALWINRINDWLPLLTKVQLDHISILIEDPKNFTDAQREFLKTGIIRPGNTVSLTLRQYGFVYTFYRGGISFDARACNPTTIAYFPSAPNLTTYWLSVGEVKKLVAGGPFARIYLMDRAFTVRQNFRPITQFGLSLEAQRSCAMDFAKFQALEKNWPREIKYPLFIEVAQP